MPLLPGSAQLQLQCNFDKQNWYQQTPCQLIAHHWIKFDPFCLHWSCSPSTCHAAGKRDQDYSCLCLELSFQKWMDGGWINFLSQLASEMLQWIVTRFVISDMFLFSQNMDYNKSYERFKFLAVSLANKRHFSFPPYCLLGFFLPQCIAFLIHPVMWP